MAFSTTSVATNNIASLDDQPNDVGGLTAAQLKAKFDQFGTDFKSWFNTTHIGEHNNIPACRVYNGADQSVSSGSYVALSFASERFDTDNIHDGAVNNSRLTCKTAGKYLISGNASFAANAAGTRRVAIRFNGTDIIGLQSAIPATGYLTEMFISTIFVLAVNDYVELVVLQDSGAPLNVGYISGYSPEFMMIRLG